MVNSAIKVVGRLDAAEASRPEYGFLPPAQRQAGPDRQARHHVHQPARHPGAAGGRVPVPGLGHPARPRRGRRPAPRCARWCSRPTRSRWSARPATAADPPTTTSRSREARVKMLHTSDWHVGKVLKGQSRVDEQLAVLARHRGHRRGRAARPGHRGRRPVRHRRPDAPRPRRSSVRALTRAAPPRRRGRGHRRQPRPRRRARRAAHLGRRGRHHAAGHAGQGRGPPHHRRHRGGEPWRLAALPFLSQRYAVRASEMFELSAAEASATYADHVARLIAALTGRLRRRHDDGQPGHRAPDRRRRQARRRRARRAHHRGVRGAGDDLPGLDPLRGAGPPAPPPAGARPVPGALLRQPARDRLRRGGEPPSVSIVERYGDDGGQGPRGADRRRPCRCAPCGARLRRAGRADRSTRRRGCGSTYASSPGPGCKEEVQELLPRALEVRIDPQALPELDPAPSGPTPGRPLAERAVRRVPRPRRASPTRPSAALFNELHDELLNGAC